jgi:hypothetical protein
LIFSGYFGGAGNDAGNAVKAFITSAEYRQRFLK